MPISLTRAAGLLIGDLLNTAEADQVDGILFELSVGLYTSPVVIGPNMVLADFTAATFGGYAALTAQTFGSAYLNTSNEMQMTSPRLQWVVTSITDPEVLRGYYCWREGTPDVLIMAESFEDPITVDQVGDGLAFVINFILALTGHGNHTFVP